MYAYSQLSAPKAWAAQDGLKHSSEDWLPYQYQVVAVLIRSAFAPLLPYCCLEGLRRRLRS
eukprot:jgi/Chlat1/7368/Chrsp6S07481